MFMNISQLPASSIGLPPKMGRLPSAPGNSRPVLDSAQGAFAAGKDARWDARFIVYAFALIGLLALLLSVFLQNDRKPSEDARIPPLVTAETPVAQSVSVETADAKLTGQIAAVPSVAQSIENVAVGEVASQTPVDKTDRERLLSIVSNY